jgi:hypothetical protein
LAALALGTAVPLGTIARLVVSLVSTEPAAAGWEERLVTAITRWTRDHPEVVESVGGDLPGGWEKRLVNGFNEIGAAAFLGTDRLANERAVDLIARAVFLPYAAAGWEQSRVAATALLRQLPDLVLDASGDMDAIALRTVLGANFAQVLEALDADADHAGVRVGDRTAVVTYLAGLRSFLDLDPWARLIGGPERTLETGFIARHVRHRDESQDIESLADDCSRLVVLGEPGSGKSWVARYLAIRSADASLANLDERRPITAEADSTNSDAETAEIPLFARASAVLDAPDHLSPWESLTRAAIGPLKDLIGADGVEALRARLDRHLGRYLVILDGLDEAVRYANADRIDSLLSTPGRKIRIILTSRPAAWRLQVSIDPTLPSSGKVQQAVVHLEPLTDPEVRSNVAAILSGRPNSQSTLLDRLDEDEQLASLAKNPLACLMLCAWAFRLESLPLSRTELYSGVVAMLVKTTWRGEASEAAIGEATQALLQVAYDAAVNDPVSGQGAWPDLVSMPKSMALSNEARLCIDGVAPAQFFDPTASSGLRRFIHQSVRAHLVAERISGFDATTAAGCLRDHLWFDPDWADVVASALVLHTHRAEVLRMLLDVPHDQPLSWAAFVTLDGFGEVRRLLRLLAVETAASDWDEPSRRLITRVAHEHLAEMPESRMRLELVRKGWPDDLTVEQHVAAISAGYPHWPNSDIASGIRWLDLTHAQRQHAATRMADLLRTCPYGQSQPIALALNSLCDDDLPTPREVGIRHLLDRLDEVPIPTWVDSMLSLRPQATDRLRAAKTITSWLEQHPRDEWTELIVPELIAKVTKLTSEADLLSRARAVALSAFLETNDDTYAEAFAPAFDLLRGQPESCAAAIRHALMIMENQGSYEKRVLQQVIEKLQPFPQWAASTLAILLAGSPSEWPRWNVTVEVMDLLASTVDSPDLEQITVNLIERLPLAELKDVDRLGELIDLFKPNPKLRAHATEELLTRLGSTPGSVMLSCALGLRRLRPSIKVGAAAADAINKELLKATDHRLRFALATGILWFAAERAARDSAVDQIVEHLDALNLLSWFQAQAWFAGEVALPEERARYVDALVRLMGDAPDSTARQVARDLIDLNLTAQQRADAVDALLIRLSANPATHPHDWLLPAANLGASRDRLIEANADIVAALPEIKLHGGSSFALGQTWMEVPLTQPQLKEAGKHLINALATENDLSLEAIAKLLTSLTLPMALREEGHAVLIRRYDKTKPADRRWVTRAIRLFDPEFRTDKENAADLLRKLKRKFDLHIAERLVTLQPTESQRNEVVDLVIRWAMESKWAQFELDQLEHLADTLKLSASELNRETFGSKETSEPIRCLARSARRRCSSDDWRKSLIQRDQSRVTKAPPAKPSGRGERPLRRGEPPPGHKGRQPG